MMMKEKGFTFIELLVTVTIILVISSIAVVSYQAANRKARDNKRRADLEQIRAALEMIRTDAGRYSTASFCPPPSAGAQWACDANSDGADEVYMNQYPTDPKGYLYYFAAISSGYNLYAYLENGGDGGDYGDHCGVPDGIGCNYRLGNP